MCGVLMRPGSVVTRVHVAGGCRLRKQADTHRQPASGRSDGQCSGERDASQRDWGSGEVDHTDRYGNTANGAVFLSDELTRHPEVVQILVQGSRGAVQQLDAVIS